MTTLKDRFQDGCAVITGAGSGIGSALARQLAEAGMDVVIADNAVDRLGQVEKALSEHGANVLALPTDVRDPHAVDRLSDAAYERFGAVGLLVNNAGIESMGKLWEMSTDNWNRVQEVNTNGTFNGIRSFVARMGADPAPSCITNIASVAAISSGTLSAAYYTSKHAVLALTECLYLECQEYFPQIDVSVVCPAAVTTEIFEDSLVDGGYVGSPTREKLESIRQHLREDGITAADAARSILDGVVKREFWINTHPLRFEEMAAQRAEMLATMSAPRLSGSFSESDSLP